ncbi:maleylpyruvate isomerase N-terminal domain-containing protein [Catellatospora sp. NPDC049609]|uniref:maleylpyruvate isomerase N-terminal domain-containing protein n=1 Tax=Catellatospora sp. NPDC049609 TaxID=3155505 RepID=UPI003431376D
MSNSPDAVIDALRSGHDELTAVVRGLSEKELTGPSGAAEWDVSQVLSHLGSGAEIHLAALETSLAGKPNPGSDFNQGVWARWDAMSPVDRAEGFQAANDKLLERYQSLDAGTRADLRVDMGFLPAPVDVATAAGMRLSEYAFHSWDVRVGADPAAAVAPEAVPLLSRITPGMLAWIARTDRLDGREVTLRVETTDPDEVHGLRLADKVELTGPPQQPDGVLRLPAEAWLRLLVGRLSPQHTPAAVETGGAADLTLLRQVFPGF